MADTNFPSLSPQMNPDYWQSNSACTTCNGCSLGFSATRPVHHCRGCGLLFCAECTPYRREDSRWKVGPVRFCKKCFEVRGRLACFKALLNPYPTYYAFQFANSTCFGCLHSGYMHFGH